VSACASINGKRCSTHRRSQCRQDLDANQPPRAVVDGIDVIDNQLVGEKSKKCQTNPISLRLYNELQEPTRSSPIAAVASSGLARRTYNEVSGSPLIYCVRSEPSAEPILPWSFSGTRQPAAGAVRLRVPSDVEGAIVTFNGQGL
jgi:hypothetical protein